MERFHVTDLRSRSFFFGVFSLETSGFQHVSWQLLFKIQSLDKMYQYNNERHGL